MRGGLCLVAAAAALLGCSDSSSPGDEDTGGGDATVAVTNNQFTPGTVEVPVNSTVTWQWNSGGVEHNVTFQDGPASGNLTSGSYPRTFQSGGSYPYVCTIHAAEGMTGVVNVSATTGGDGGTDAGGDTGGGGGGYP